MASYTQWRAFADSKDPKRVTWVCGPIRLLIEEIVEETKLKLNVSDMDYSSFIAGSDPEREIWAAANQYSMYPGASRLILVRNAEKLKRWDMLDAWLKQGRALPGVYLLLISNELDFPYNRDGTKKLGVVHHIEQIRAGGYAVRCSMPNEDDVVSWTQRRTGLDQQLSRFLLERAGGNLSLVANVGRKLAIFDTSGIGKKILSQLCDDVPRDGFVDSLLAGNKPEALICLAHMSVQDYSKTIGLIAARVDMLLEFNKMLLARKTLKDAAIAHPSPFLVQRYFPLAKHFPASRVAHLRRVVAVCDQALRDGATQGVLEALVALW